MEDLKTLHLTLPSLERLMEDFFFRNFGSDLNLNISPSIGTSHFGITPSHIELLMEDFEWWTGVWDRCISRGYRLVCTVGRLGKCSPSKQVAGK